MTRKTRNTGNAFSSHSLALLLLTTACAVPTVGQEEGLPPGPGWMSAGPASWTVGGSAPGRAPDGGSTPPWARLSLSRPFGLPDLRHATAAAVLPLPWEGLSLEAAFHHVSGDDMRHAAFRFGIALPIGPAAWSATASLGAVLHRVGWTSAGGAGGAAASGVHLGLGSEHGPVTTWLYWEEPMSGWLGRRLTAAVGYRGESFGVSAGHRVQQGRASTRGLVACLRSGRLGFVLGGWGTPPVPSAALTLLIQNVESLLEIRHTPGAGTSLLWSVRIGSAGKR